MYLYIYIFVYKLHNLKCLFKTITNSKYYFLAGKNNFTITICPLCLDPPQFSNDAVTLVLFSSLYIFCYKFINIEPHELVLSDESEVINHRKHFVINKITRQNCGRW